jgi:hypothetical protein
VQEIIHLDSEGAELGEKTFYLSLHNDYSTLFEALRIDTGYVALITNPHTARHTVQYPHLKTKQGDFWI